jgi:hypothetical protein
MTASRDTPAKPNHRQNGMFITSGEIGTNAMHPPGKRSMDINRIDENALTPSNIPIIRIAIN